MFSYTVGFDDDPDNDHDGIWIGDHTRTLKLDAGDAIRSVATGTDAILDHDDLGTLFGHKVDGSRQGGIHTHPEFTHSHAHYSRGKGYYTEDYPDHTHPSHAHPDGSNSHPPGCGPASTSTTSRSNRTRTATLVPTSASMTASPIPTSAGTLNPGAMRTTTSTPAGTAASCQGK